MPHRVRIALATTALLLGCAAPAAAISGDAAIAHLNAQRTANGIPGDVVHAPGLSDGCDKHNNYMALNRQFGHGEQPGKPGYTPEGAGTAPGSFGFSEVLSGAKAWDNGWVNPWANAPLHLMSMFNPAITGAGYADSHGYTCMRLGGLRVAPGTYSLPGDGATGVASIQDATGERPYSPAQAAGLSGATGYNILLWRGGASYDIALATVTGPRGPVEVRPVDSRTRTPDGSRWGSSGAVLVPARPLDAEATYAVDVTFTDGATHHSVFSTAPRDPQLEGVRVGAGVDGKLTVYAPALAAITAIQVAGRKGPVTMTADPAEPHRFMASGLRPDFYTACVRAGGPGTGYSPRSACDTAEMRLDQKVSVKPAKGRRLRLTVGKAFIAARRATLTLSNRSGRVLKVHRFRLVTRSFARPKGAASYVLRAKAAGGYLPIARTDRLR